MSSTARVACRTVTLLCCAACSPAQVRYAAVETPAPAAAQAQVTLFLVGDAGEVNAVQTEVLTHLRENIATVAANGSGPPVVVAFLGDIIYEVGARADHEAEDRAVLDAQVDALGTSGNVRGVFVPGNHDWAKGNPDAEGRAAINLLADWLDRDAPTASLLPDDACPGPATIDVGESIHIVSVDTEWLLREPSDQCGTVDDFFARLTADLERNRDRRTVLLSHHPFATGGPHGGNVAPLSHGPLVYFLAIKSGVSVQDLASPRYADMMRRFEDAFRESGHAPFVHAAGHDHNLQVIRLATGSGPRYQLVSGSAARTERARRIEGTRYATDGFGYMRLDFGPTDARLIVYARDVEAAGVRPVFSCVLSEAAPDEECPEAALATGGS